MTSDKQLSEWVKGNPIHNQTRNECCPDFSCCQPELLAPKETREEFLKASEKDRIKMLFTFLGAGIREATTKKVYIAGTIDEDEHE